MAFGETFPSQRDNGFNDSVNRLLSSVVSSLGWREEFGVWQCQQVLGKKKPLVSTLNVTAFLFLSSYFLWALVLSSSFIAECCSGAAHGGLKGSLPTQGFNTGWCQCFHTAKVHSTALSCFILCLLMDVLHLCTAKWAHFIFKKPVCGSSAIKIVKRN